MKTVDYPIIKVTSPSFSKNNNLRQVLCKSFPASRFNETGKELSREELAVFLSDADGAIISLGAIDNYILDNCKKLRIISKYGVGIDNIDIPSCTQRGIVVQWTPGTNKTSVAEKTLSFMLALLHNIHTTSMQLKSGIWNKDGGVELSGKIIGIIGVGNVGKELIRLLKPFNCRILVNDIIDQKEYYASHGVIETSKEEIFRCADVVTLHVPITPETNYLVNVNTLALMKPSAVIINTSRGKVVNQKDIKEVLRTKRIAGAALDVFEQEPITDMSLLSLPTLICTPHIGGNSVEAVNAMGLSAIDHLKEFFKVK